MRVRESMEILTSPFPIPLTQYSKLHFPFKAHLPNLKPICRASIIPPPADFDFKNEILRISTSTIAKTHPELLDLALNGTLVLINKSQYGPVPPWRSEFVEPEAIWLIGTTHISQESASDVLRVIRALRPDNVVVELCRSRAGIMYTSDNGELNQQLRSNMFSLSGSGFFGAVGRSINLGGQTALALRLLFAAFSSKMSSDIDRPFGDEFRAARKASEEIGAQIVLGDRPIEITLERAWSSLKWKEKLSLVSTVIRGITSSKFSKDTLKIHSLNNEKSAGMFFDFNPLPIKQLVYDLLKESSTSDDNFQLYDQLSSSYPSLLPPLIYERDTYLAWSLKRSKAVNNSKKVVGVMGKGHMNGVIYSLVSDQGNLRFRDLAGKRPSGDDYGWVGSIAKDLVRDTAIGILLWLLYEQIKSML